MQVNTIVNTIRRNVIIYQTNHIKQYFVQLLYDSMLTELHFEIKLGFLTTFYQSVLLYFSYFIVGTNTM